MLRGFNTLRYEANLEGAGLAPDAGLTPEGLDHEPPEQEPQGWQGVSEEQWNAQQEQLTQMGQIIEQLAPVAQYIQNVPGADQDQQQEPEFDLFADDSAEQIRRMIREETAPYREIVQERQLEELESRAYDMISDVESAQGELLRPKYDEGQKGLNPGDLVLQIAQSYSPEMVAQYGPGVRADEAAIAKAYEDIKVYQEALLTAAEERQQNQLHSLAGAAREPGNSGIASQPLVTTQSGGWDAFKARHNIS